MREQNITQQSNYYLKSHEEISTINGFGLDFSVGLLVVGSAYVVTLVVLIHVPEIIVLVLL